MFWLYSLKIRLGVLSGACWTDRWWRWRPVLDRQMVEMAACAGQTDGGDGLCWTDRWWRWRPVLCVQHRPPSPPSVCPAQAAISNICLSSTGHNLYHMSVQYRPQSLPYLSSTGHNLYHLSVQYRPQSPTSTSRHLLQLCVQHRPPSTDRWWRWRPVLDRQMVEMAACAGHTAGGDGGL